MAYAALTANVWSSSGRCSQGSAQYSCSENLELHGDGTYLHTSVDVGSGESRGLWTFGLDAVTPASPVLFEGSLCTEESSASAAGLSLTHFRLTKNTLERGGSTLPVGAALPRKGSYESLPATKLPDAAAIVLFSGTWNVTASVEGFPEVIKFNEDGRWTATGGGGTRCTVSGRISSITGAAASSYREFAFADTPGSTGAFCTPRASDKNVLATLGLDVERGYLVVAPGVSPGQVTYAVVPDGPF